MHKTAQFQKNSRKAEGTRTQMAKLGSQIDEAIGVTRKNYDDAVKTVERLKAELNTLERKLIRNTSYRQLKTARNLESVLNSISELSDLLIVRSREAWDTYRRLQRKCGTRRIRRLKTAKLDELKALCVKTEAIASDLLCYSLGQQRTVTRPLWQGSSN